MTATAAMPARRGAGRPPRLTLKQVVDAACEIGLDKVDMVSVARKLGIGVATLYGYVEGRDHLIRLAAQRLAGRSGIEDEGQSWQDALREHASRSFATYRATPQLIRQLMSGQLGDMADSGHADALLALLLDRGLSPERALTIFLQANQLVIGAAVGAAYAQSMADSAGSERDYIAQDRAKSDEKGYKALSRCLEAGNLFDIAGDYGSALERLIAANEAEMAA